jgi:hypothetical protein
MTMKTASLSQSGTAPSLRCNHKQDAIKIIANRPLVLAGLLKKLPNTHAKTLLFPMNLFITEVGYFGLFSGMTFSLQA